MDRKWSRDSSYIKNATHRISNKIKTRPKIPWPPTFQQISEDTVNANVSLYNFLALLVSPCSSIDGTVTVRLSGSKFMKITKICPDIEALLTSCNISSLQFLISRNMYRKTGWNNIVTEIHEFGVGQLIPMFCSYKTSQQNEASRNHLILLQIFKKGKWLPT